LEARVVAVLEIEKALAMPRGQQNGLPICEEREGRVEALEKNTTDA